MPTEGGSCLFSILKCVANDRPYIVNGGTNDRPYIVRNNFSLLKRVILW